MNAGAYGGTSQACSSGRSSRMRPAPPGARRRSWVSSTGARRCVPARSSWRRSFACGEAGQEIKATVAEMQGDAQGAQPTNNGRSGGSSESRARVVGGADARGLQASRPPHRRCAGLAQARETSSRRRRRRSTDAIELMAEARGGERWRSSASARARVWLLGPIECCSRGAGRGDLRAASGAVCVSASPALRLVPPGRSFAIGFGLLAAAFGLSLRARRPSSPFTKCRSSRSRVANPPRRPEAGSPSQHCSRSTRRRSSSASTSCRTSTSGLRPPSRTASASG